MSEHSNILAKYEKMFEDGSAYKPIKLNQQTPSMSEAGGGGVPEMSETPLGDPNTGGGGEAKPIFNEGFDASRSNAMEQKIAEAMKGTPTGNPHANTQPVTVQNDGYEKLERRIAMLEQALTLVMEQQTKMLRESK